MTCIAAGRMDDLPPDIRLGLGAYRYDVFVRRLGWALAHDAGGEASEWDQFDCDATVHVVALGTGRLVCGCARLLPTTGPYLLRDVFPQLLGQHPPPVSPMVWELSRFAASVPRPQMGRACARDAPGMALFPYALAVAASLGATSIVGVVTLSIERLYRRASIDLQRIGAIDGRPHARVAACSVELSPRTFVRLGSNAADLMQAVRWFGPVPADVNRTAPGTTQDRRSVTSYT